MKNTDIEIVVGKYVLSLIDLEKWVSTCAFAFSSTTWTLWLDDFNCICVCIYILWRFSVKINKCGGRTRTFSTANTCCWTSLWTSSIHVRSSQPISPRHVLICSLLLLSLPSVVYQEICPVLIDLIACNTKLTVKCLLFPEHLPLILMPSSVDLFILPYVTSVYHSSHFCHRCTISYVTVSRSYLLSSSSQ